MGSELTWSSTNKQQQLVRFEALRKREEEGPVDAGDATWVELVVAVATQVEEDVSTSRSNHSTTAQAVRLYVGLLHVV